MKARFQGIQFRYHMCAHQSPHLVQRLILTNEANPKIHSTSQVENTNNLPLWQIVAKITFGVSQLDFGENHQNIRGVAAAESCLISSERIKLPTYKHGDESCTQLRGEVSSVASVKILLPLNSSTIFISLQRIGLHSSGSSKSSKRCAEYKHNLSSTMCTHMVPHHVPE